MKRKTLLSLLLVLCMLLALAPAAALAEDNAQARPPQDEEQALDYGYYIIGRNGWTYDSLTKADHLEQNWSASEEEYKLQTTLREGETFKVVLVSGGSIAQWFPDPGDNYVVDAAHAGEMVIYFRPNYQNDWAQTGGYIWVAEQEKFHITFDQPEHAALSVDREYAPYGATVTLTVDLEEGYVVSQLKPFSVFFQKSTDTSYTFTMPSYDITITAMVYVDAGYYFEGGKNVADLTPADRFREQASPFGTYCFDVELEEGDSLALVRITTDGSWSWNPSKADPVVAADQVGRARIFLSETEWDGSETERDGYIKMFSISHWDHGTKVYDMETWMLLKYYHPVTVRTAQGGSVSTDLAEALEGDTVTLTVLPEEGQRLENLTVSDGEHEIPLTQVNETTYSFLMPDAAVTVTPLFTQPQEDCAEIYGASLSLKGNIGLNFYVFLPENLAADSSAYVTLDEAQFPVTQAPTQAINGRTAYRFSAEVPAKEMGREITLRVFDGQGQPVTLKLREEDLTETGFSYSVRNYLDKQIHEGSAGKLQNLCIAMRDYGSCAQLVFGYEAENRAEILGELSQVTAETLRDFEAVKVETEGAGVSYVGSSLLLKSETTMRHYFKLSQGEIGDYTFTLDGVALTPVAYGSYWYVDDADIAAKDLDKAPTLQVTHAGTVIFTLNNSPLGYAYSVLNGKSSDENLLNQMRALYLYWQAAESYFAD